MFSKISLMALPALDIKRLVVLDSVLEELINNPLLEKIMTFTEKIEARPDLFFYMANLYDGHLEEVPEEDNDDGTIYIIEFKEVSLMFLYDKDEMVLYLGKAIIPRSN